MAGTPPSLQRLRAAPQSIWLDFISRPLLDSGDLARMIEDGVIHGLTSNPSIFSKAIAGSHDYDDALAALAAGGVRDPYEAFVAIAVEDIRRAADAFASTYRNTGGTDGFVSLELPPGIENDTGRSIIEAQRLAGLIDRPNLMIKVPGTSAGIETARQLIAAGINVNVTLLFSVGQYAGYAEAYVAGLEERHRLGLPLGGTNGVASVASFFVSRVDTAIDPTIPESSPLRGQVAIANALAAYRHFEDLIATPRWHAIAAAGASVQRPLWGSTGTKNPAYSDVLYVDRLALPQTVNTLPLPTIEAFLDHGDGATVDRAALDGAMGTLASLAGAGVDLDAVTARLLVEGLASFQADFDTLLQRVGEALAVRSK
ncbi:MAG: transaldolase [Dehalococcoidia bacterium]|nr:transaldolase [Dehalococcoidia bacterium]